VIDVVCIPTLLYLAAVVAVVKVRFVLIIIYISYASTSYCFSCTWHFLVDCHYYTSIASKYPRRFRSQQCYISQEEFQLSVVVDTKIFGVVRLYVHRPYVASVIGNIHDSAANNGVPVRYIKTFEYR
jgi:hypothetical protein